MNYLYSFFFAVFFPVSPFDLTALIQFLPLLISTSFLIIVFLLIPSVTLEAKHLCVILARFSPQNHLILLFTCVFHCNKFIC